MIATLPALPDLAVLADDPSWVVGVAVAWCSIGVLAAWLLHRRGHGFGPNAALGLAFGPLYIGLAVPSARDREREVAPRVLDLGRPGGGAVDVLVALDGSDGADPAALRRWLDSLRPALGVVALARSVDYESAGREEAPPHARALRDLEEWAAHLDGYRPRTVLVPGTPERAVLEYAAAAGYALVVAPGGWASPVVTRERRAPAQGGDVPVLVLPALVAPA